MSTVIERTQDAFDEVMLAIQEGTITRAFGDRLLGHIAAIRSALTDLVAQIEDGPHEWWGENGDEDHRHPSWVLALFDVEPPRPTYTVVERLRSEGDAHLRGRRLWCEQNESAASAHGHTDACYRARQ